MSTQYLFVAAIKAHHKNFKLIMQSYKYKLKSWIKTVMLRQLCYSKIIFSHRSVIKSKDHEK